MSTETHKHTENDEKYQPIERTRKTDKEINQRADDLDDIVVSTDLVDFGSKQNLEDFLFWIGAEDYEELTTGYVIIHGSDVDVVMYHNPFDPSDDKPYGYCSYVTFRSDDPEKAYEALVHMINNADYVKGTEEGRIGEGINIA
jgi:hypothetical protein